MKNCFIILISLSLIGCSAINPPHPNPTTGINDKLASTAYNTVVGAKGFLDSVRSAHPECKEVSSTNPNIIIAAARTNENRICHLLVQATAAKDLIIDAGEEYCGGGTFETGGACNPPNKGTPKYQILQDKLKSSVALYNSVEKDLKGLR